MELLVCIDTSPNGNHPRGDVLHAAPDGHVWGRDEARHPWLRVIRVPDLPAVEAVALLLPELGDSDRNHHLHARGWRLDLDALAAGHPDHEARLTPKGGACHASVGHVEIDVPTIRRLTARKSPLPSPTVIGPPSPTVIG